MVFLLCGTDRSGVIAFRSCVPRTDARSRTCLPDLCMSASSSSASAAASAAAVLGLRRLALRCEAAGCQFRIVVPDRSKLADAEEEVWAHQLQCPFVIAETDAAVEQAERELEEEKQRATAEEAEMQEKMQKKKEKLAAQEAFVRQQKQAIKVLHQQAAGQAQAQPMEEEKSEPDASHSALPQPPAAAASSSAAAAAGAAAASPANQHARKRQRQSEQKQSEEPSGTAANDDADEEADAEGAEDTDAASGPAAKAPRTKRSADAASAASAAAPVSSRPRAPQAPASSRGLTPRRVAQAESDMDPDDEATAEPPRAAAASSRDAPRRSWRAPKQRLSQDYALIAAAGDETAARVAAAASREAVPRSSRPASQRFPKEKRGLKLRKELVVDYGRGKPIQVYEDADHSLRIDFEELYPRGERNSFFKPKPAEEIFRQITQGKYDSDDRLTPAMRYLYYFVDHHAEFEARARIQASGMEYMDLLDDVRLVDGKPYVTVVALFQTLMQLPYLSNTKFAVLKNEYELLEEAIDEAYEAQKQLPAPKLQWPPAEESDAEESESEGM